jgi:hypothetical protein
MKAIDSEALERFADFLAEEAMNTSDEEILAEAREIYGDENKLAGEATAIFERAWKGARPNEPKLDYAQAFELMPDASGWPRLIRQEYTDTSKSGNIGRASGIPEKPKGQVSETLESYFKEKNLPPSMWPDTVAEIERLVNKKLATNKTRPLWDERAEDRELADLSAPKFLKRVWADQIAPDGTLVKEDVRAKDRSLMASVEAYIKGRKRKVRDDGSIDYGDAEGLLFISRPGGRPQKHHVHMHMDKASNG